jgi:UTP--glucose-1-phosphate uridylyltransferase
LAKIAYVRQQQPPLGLGHAVLMAKGLVPDPYFAVFLPDDIMDCEVPCMKQMCEAFARMPGGIVAVTRTDDAGKGRYGIVQVEPTDNPRLHKIIDIVEKPGAQNAPSDMAVMGRYILPQEIFSQLEKTEKGSGNEIQLTDAIRALLNEKDFYAFEYEGERLDAGELKGYLEATVKLALKRDDLRENLLEYIKTVV